MTTAPRMDDWVRTDGSRPEAVRTSVLRHSWSVFRSRLARRRGNSRLVEPPQSTAEVLARLAELPLSVWTYGFDHDSVRHMGPMAQDFARAFGLGHSDREIDMVDANGVLMACVQALLGRVEAMEQQLEAMRPAPAPDASDVPDASGVPNASAVSAAPAVSGG
ncbi:hypothetical protein AB0K51_05080 [Kitasatospora sp. NPDC049285]|uniref:hypothetical protein n=1 Tax=Kitasatospora sp. NPDC049285 TaxID=3157096 RepID=UPI00341C4DD2